MDVSHEQNMFLMSRISGERENANLYSMAFLKSGNLYEGWIKIHPQTLNSTKRSLITLLKDGWKMRPQLECEPATRDDIVQGMVSRIIGQGCLLYTSRCV